MHTRPLIPSEEKVQIAFWLFFLLLAESRHIIKQHENNYVGNGEMVLKEIAHLKVVFSYILFVFDV